MNRVWVALIASAVSGSAFAQSSVLYLPAKIIKDQGITVRPWGSGTISETDETAFEGTHSIRVSTRNFFQGGVVNFGNPIDLSQDYLTKTNLLRVTFKVADAGPISGGGGIGKGGGRPGGLGGPGFGAGAPGAGAGAGPGAPGGGGQRGGRPGGLGGPGFGAQGPGGGIGKNGPGGFGPGAPGGGASGEKPVLKTIRLIVTTTDGKKSEVYAPANTSTATDQGWSTVAVPLQAITGLDRTNKIVKSIAFAGNTTSTFFVGDVRVVNDSTPIQGEINSQNPINAALGDEYELTASGFGGSSILKYTWDFDDKDGIQVDAEGQSVKHKFNRPGNFVITLTISDYYGLKPPYTATIKVTVNP